LTSPSGSPRSLFDRPYLLLTLVSLFWAINIVVGRLVAGTIPPIMLAQIRWGGAAILLLPFALPHLKRDWPAVRSRFWLMCFLSLTGVTLYNTLGYYALQYTGAINGSLFQSTGPLWVAVFSFLLFRDFLSAGQSVGILLSILGVAVMITRGDPAALLHLDFNVGDLWFVLAVAIYSLYTAMLRLRPPMHSLSFLVFTIVIGAILLLPATGIEWAQGHRMEITPTSVMAFIYVAIFPSILAYLFFNRGVELIGANQASPFLYLIPVFGSAIAILFLGERPALYHGIGCVLIIAGIFLAQKWRTKTPA